MTTFEPDEPTLQPEPDVVPEPTGAEDVDAEGQPLDAEDSTQSPSDEL